MIGVVPEDLALFDNLTAREHLTFIGRMYLLPKDTIRTRIDELIVMMGLQNDETKLTLEYSHGMKKKLALAAALLPNPDLLFLDEPFEGVDAVTSRVIRDMLAGFVHRGSTVFMTSHVLAWSKDSALMWESSQMEPSWSRRRWKTSGKAVLSKQRFLEKVGADEEAAQKLSWLEES